MTDTGPLYPNQQLRSVSLETHFEGAFSALGRLEQVQRHFRDRFPHLFVPNAVDGRALSMQPFQLRSSAEQTGECLAVAINQATYFTFGYPGHTAFMKHGLEVLLKTLEMIDIVSLRRVTYRYDNAIGLARLPDGALPLRKVLRDECIAPWCGADSLGSIGLAWEAKWRLGRYETAVRVVEEDGIDVVRLTIASTVEPAGSVVELGNNARAAHDHAVERFEGLITNDFRRVLEDGGSL